MNFSRFIATITIVLSLATIVNAQRTDSSSNSNISDITRTDKQESTTEQSIRRSATADLFTRGSTPFTKKSSEGTTPQPQDPDDADKWHFQVTPYFWLAGINGRAGINNLIADVDASITQSDVDLNFGIMGTFEARKNKFIILTDLQYSDLGTDRATPGPLFTDASADFKTFVLDPEVGYRIFENENGNYVDVLGGIRYWHLKMDLTFNAGLLSSVSASRSRGWVDGVGGIRGRAYLTKRVFVTGKADLGGGGSRISYQLFGAGGILIGSRYALIAGYRDLDVNYSKDGFLFDMALHGPILGFGIKF